MSLSNYGYGLTDSSPDTPWNEPYVPEKDFEVTCCQTLSRTATVWTNNYIPGAEGVDYEYDVDGPVACSWQDDDDTSNTNWSQEYNGNGYYTPLQLIQLFKEFLENQYNNTSDTTPEGKKECRRLKGLIEECECWSEDETDFELG